MAAHPISYISPNARRSLDLIDESRFDEVFNLLSSLIDSDPDCLALLGHCFVFGYGTKVDLNRALDLTQRSKERGSDLGIVLHAFAVLSDLQDEGHEGEDVLEILLQLAEGPGKGELKAIVADAFLKGRMGANLDGSRALNHSKLAMTTGNAYGLTRMGLCYDRGVGVPNQDDTAVSYYLKADAKGHVVATQNLAIFYDNGRGGLNDKRKAVEFYEKGAEAGFARSLHNLAIKYRQGNGVEENLDRATELYERAVEQHFLPSYCNLALLYQRKEKTDKAIRLFEIGSKHNDSCCQFNLGCCFFDGQGVEKDLGRAITLISQAADLGNPEAQCRLGYAYETGEGVEMDPQKAIELYRAAAEKGDTIAHYNLAVNYQLGKNVEKNNAEAVKYYSLAANKGDPDSMFWLGCMYESGKGVEMDLEKAGRLFLAAADGGSAFAASKVKELDFTMNIKGSDDY